MKRAIMMNPKDNVVTALASLSAGDVATVVSRSQEVLQELSVPSLIPFGHKVAVEKIRMGTSIIKYGEVIGVAMQDIDRGQHVHVHNVESTRIKMPRAIREREG
jgi:altronate dehydratase small subunit